MLRHVPRSRSVRTATLQPAATCLALSLGLSALVAGCSGPPNADTGPDATGSGVAGAGGSVAGAAGSASAAPQGGSAGSAGAGSGGSANTSQGGNMSAGLAGAPGIGGAGGDVLTSAICPESALFCDDFEDDALAQPPGAPWRMSVNDGSSINVDGAQAFSGSQAAHVNATLGANYRRGYMALDQGSQANIFPAAAQEMYGRAMMYLQEGLANQAHWTFIQGEGRSADDSYNALYRYGGQEMGGTGLMANFETTQPPRSDCYQHSSSSMPVAAWTCVEWRFIVASNEMQFWLNGSELTDLHVVNSGTGPRSGCVFDEPPLNGQWLAPPAFQTLYLGWEHYQTPGNEINLWIDNVVVSRERIGCPAP